MLFTDADFISKDDLLAIDPEAERTAAAVNIALDSSTQNIASNVCAQAIDEVGKRILADSQSVQGYLTPWTAPYNQTAAVLNATLPSVNRRRIYLSQIVVSDPGGYNSPVKTFAIYQALWWLFRAAFRRHAGEKGADRLKDKMKEYEREITNIYYPRFFREGLPVVYKPLPCPGAIHEFNVGTFGSSNVTTVAGTNANQPTDYDVAITWTDTIQGYISPSNKGVGESAPSARVTLPVPTSNVIQVNTSGLTPPNGSGPVNQQLGQGLFLFGTASGWNVYVGNSGGPLYLQNATPVPIGTSSYTLVGAPVLSGPVADAGQLAQSTYTMERVMGRG